MIAIMPNGRVLTRGVRRLHVAAVSLYDFRCVLRSASSGKALLAALWALGVLPGGPGLPWFPIRHELHRLP